MSNLLESPIIISNRDAEKQAEKDYADYLAKRGENVSGLDIETLLPIDPIDIGETLWDLNFDITDEGLADCDDGMCDMAHKKIIINTRNRSFQRCRYTMAHEIGHYSLHRAGILSQAQTNDKFSEYQANTYAAALLMPRVYVEAMLSIKQQSISDSMVRKIAEKFDVSYDTAKFRLDALVRGPTMTRESMGRAKNKYNMESELDRGYWAI